MCTWIMWDPVKIRLCTSKELPDDAHTASPGWVPELSLLPLCLKGRAGHRAILRFPELLTQDSGLDWPCQQPSHKFPKVHLGLLRSQLHWQAFPSSCHMSVVLSSKAQAQAAHAEGSICWAFPNVPCDAKKLIQRCLAQKMQHFQVC